MSSQKNDDLPAYEEFSNNTIDDYPADSGPLQEEDRREQAEIGSKQEFAPPSYPPPSHSLSALYSEAPADECELAIDYCRAHPLYGNPITEVEVVDKLLFRLVAPPSPGLNKYSRYSTARRFKGDIRQSGSTWYIRSQAGTKDCCFVSDLPLYNPHQDIHDGKLYYEILVTALSRPEEAAVAIGYSVLPYPPFRLPGWHRGSVAIHSDDGHKYFSNDQYGSPCTNPFSVGDTIGVGLDLNTRSLVVTKNGKLEVQLSIRDEDPLIVSANQSIYACIGIYGSIGVQANFGSQTKFRYKFFEIANRT